ncbi:uncharacterized protein NPIL_574451 [Nephila pilipes]|uniref:THAP-type domain-containing protein n=1 Tax=Nephila pilipes TaxID=299642 RepID=A0A8X6TGR1_NEPPI|nr:uncharacterized protein NPIL_574451 [Nephila pilipes]
MFYCIAYGCNNKKDRKDCGTKSFFGFPLKNLSLVKTWVKMLRRDNFQATPYSKICSDHFDESCFKYQPFTNRRQLKPGSIPTIFVFSKTTSSRRVLDRCLPTTSTETTGISNEFLSVLFGISDSTVSRNFNYVTSIRNAKLKLLDIFPTKSTVIEYIPLPIRFGNKDIRIVIDCTEFPIQKPSSPVEQQLTFSRYKNTNTLKGMIGITPNGAISFISPLYCGSLSDKQLFIKSKLMDRLEPNDVVMDDKGFLIAEELESIDCKLQYPIFLKDKIRYN